MKSQQRQCNAEMAYLISVNTMQVTTYQKRLLTIENNASSIKLIAVTLIDPSK